MWHLPQKYSGQPKGNFCNNCNLYVRIKCNDISTSEYKELEKEPDEVSWFCKKCTIDMFPFGSLPNEELLGIGDFDLPSFIDSAPMVEMTSNLMDLPNLSDSDIDEYMPQNIDSRYFTLPELSSLQLSSSDVLLTDKVRNEEIYKRSHQISITTEIKKRRLNWLGHMLRLPEKTPAKLAYREHLKKAKGNRGRPKQTWIKQINKDLKPINKTVDELTENDYERKEWKKTVARLMS